MPDDKSKRGAADRRRVATEEPYEVQTFKTKHPHLSTNEALKIIREAGGDRAKADKLASARKR